MRGIIMKGLTRPKFFCTRSHAGALENKGFFNLRQLQNSHFTTVRRSGTPSFTASRPVNGCIFLLGFYEPF